MRFLRHGILLSSITVATCVVVACGSDDPDSTTPPTGDAGGIDSSRADGSTPSIDSGGSSSGSPDAGPDANGSDEDASPDSGADAGDAGLIPRDFLHCTPSAAYPAVDEFTQSVPIGTATIAGTTYLYAEFPDSTGRQILRYSVDTSTGTCSLARDTAFNATGKIVSDPAYYFDHVDATGGVWSYNVNPIVVGGKPTGPLRHDFPGTPFECTFDASVGDYKTVNRFTLNDAGTSGFVALLDGTGGSAYHFGKLTVTPTSCSITSFSISKTITSGPGMAIDANGRLVLIGTDGLTFFDPTTGNQTSNVGHSGSLLFNCAPGFCLSDGTMMIACDGTGQNCSDDPPGSPYPNIPFAYPADVDDFGGAATAAAQNDTPYFVAQIMDNDKPTRHFEVWARPLK